MTSAARAAVLGTTGCAGFELATLLLRHPHVSPVFYLREGEAPARCLTQVFPRLRSWGEAPCLPFSLEGLAKSDPAVVFLATPHTVSAELAPEITARGIPLVDLSGALRFRTQEEFAKWYGLPAAPTETLRSAVYGLPELYQEKIRGASVVANPGCYATAVILALRPLLEAGLANTAKGIVCDCKSGVSGAGKEPRQETQFISVNENLRAYGVFTHRHAPEIAAHLGLKESEWMFITHLLPVERGILSTIYVWLKEPRQTAEIESVYRKFYAGRGLIRISAPGHLPELQHVAHTNFCDIGLALDGSGERLVIVACLDNLGKGAAGQAVQNMNFMLGFPETAGLI